MAHKIYHDRSAACTDAFTLIAEGWNALVQDGAAPEYKGVSPVGGNTEVLWAPSPEGDVCGVLCFDTDPVARSIEIVLAYVEPSMRRRGVFKELVAALVSLAKEAEVERITISTTPDDNVVPHLFGSPLAARFEIKVEG